MRRLFAAAALAALASCSGGREEWRGWVYPSAADLTVSLELGTFTNFEACQATAIANLRALGRATEGDYECGLNCRWDARLGVNVCKETRK